MDEVSKAQWAQPADFKAQYRSASIFKSRLVVFNLKGDSYRLIVAIAFRLSIVYVKFSGTHAEYDGIRRYPPVPQSWTHESGRRRASIERHASHLPCPAESGSDLKGQSSPPVGRRVKAHDAIPLTWCKRVAVDCWRPV